jgi:hypothetical protein
MQSLPLTTERQQTEWNTIQTMAQNNFPEKFIKNLKVHMQQKVHQKQDKDENKKGQPSHTTVQKLENSPTSSNIPT